MIRSELSHIGHEIETRYALLSKRLCGSIDGLPLVLSFDVDCCDLLGWLMSQTSYPRFYWSSRNGECEVAGAGSAVVVAASAGSSARDAYSRIDDIHKACDDESVFFVGGQAFDTSCGEDFLWSEFAALQFVVPDLLLVRRGNSCSLQVAVKVTADSSPGSILTRVRALLSEADRRPGRIRADLPVQSDRRIDSPDFSAWCHTVRKALEMIERAEIEKVVMARRTDFSLGEKVDPIEFLATLKRISRNCFCFMFEPSTSSAFIGTTPERLCRCIGGTIETEAVSGTAVVGEFDNAVSAAGERLLSNDKNRREHDFVVKYVRERLGELCAFVSEPSGRELLTLSNVSHIHTRLSGTLRNGLSIGDVVLSLHPTPAVCGTTKERALEVIRQSESFSRGWYAGLTGVIGCNFSEMVVAIRSALVSLDRISLFAGAGIVRDSDPRQEWQELEDKIAPALGTLCGALK